MVIGFGAVAALAVGGLAGGLLRRRRHRRSTAATRSLDSDRVEVQGGWTNMQGG